MLRSLTELNGTYTESKSDAKTRFFTIALCLSPLFANYGVGIVLLPEIVFGFILMISLVYYTTKQRIIPRTYTLFLILALLSAITGVLFNDYFSFNIYFTTIFRFAFYYLLIKYAYSKWFSLKLACRICLLVAVINSIYLIVQFTANRLFGSLLPIAIPFLPIKQDGAYIQNTAYYVSIYGYRPSGLFFEPEQFSLYVVPVILFLLFSDELGIRVKHRVLAIILCSTATVLSGSGTGIGLLAITFGCYLIRGISRGTSSKRLSYFLLSILLVIIILLIDPAIVNKIPGVDRLTNTSDLSSFSVRLLRGYKAFNQYPIINKIIGVGYGNYQVYNTAMGITTIHDIESSSYVNTLAFMLTGTGILGLLVYSSQFLALLRRTSGFFRARVVLLLAVAIFTTEPLSMSVILSYAIILQGYGGKK